MGCLPPPLFSPFRVPCVAFFRSPSLFFARSDSRLCCIYFRRVRCLCLPRLCCVLPLPALAGVLFPFFRASAAALCLRCRCFSAGSVAPCGGVLRFAWLGFGRSGALLACLVVRSPALVCALPPLVLFTSLLSAGCSIVSLTGSKDRAQQIPWLGLLRRWASRADWRGTWPGLKCVGGWR